LALLSARCALTAAITCVALVLGTAEGIPECRLTCTDEIFGKHTVRHLQN
jgi:hypothetical protein